MAHEIPYRAASVLGKPTLEPVAPGVWVMRGGADAGAIGLQMLRGHLPKRTMNVYLLEDEGGVTMFDAGVQEMTPWIGDIASRMGGLKRIVLGHAHADHRGSAPGLGAPVYCHADAVGEAESTSEPSYVNYDAIEIALTRKAMPQLIKKWDGGPVKVAGTVSEGDEVAGFEVRHLPGHAPGLIGLWRASDRLAIVSDTIYTLDPLTGKFGEPRLPHAFYTQDSGRARESIRAVAALDPREVWAGHADPVATDVRARLERAADAP